MIIRGDQHVDDWAEIAVDYLDGQLDHDTRTAVEAHLSGCPDCATRLRRQQYVVSFLQETALDDSPEDLEYRSIGQIIFPSPGEQPVIKPVEEKKVYRTPGWFRELRHWIPAGVAVIALLSAVVAYGIVRSEQHNGATDSAKFASNTQTTVAAAATTAAPAMGEASPTGAGATMTTAAAGLTTTTAAAASPTYSTQTATFAATDDPKAMVRALQTVKAPAFVAFQANVTTAAAEQTTAAPSSTTVTTTAGVTDTTAPEAGGTTTATVTVTSAPNAVSSDAATSLLDQITQFTGLQPVDRSLWLGGPTFAIYLSRKDASKLVDLVRSMSASMGLTVSMEGEPPAATKENCARLLEHKASFPILQAHRAGQPATLDWDFTTSTIVTPDQATHYTGTLPDQDGNHVLVVIWIAE
jgi:anti-sigma factor RsiW